MKQGGDLCLGYSGEGGGLRTQIKRNSSRQEEGRMIDIKHINGVCFFMSHKENIYEFLLYKISSINSGGHGIQTASIRLLQCYCHLHSLDPLSTF